MQNKYAIEFPPKSLGGYDGRHFFTTQREAVSFLRRAHERCGNGLKFEWVTLSRGRSHHGQPI